MLKKIDVFMVISSQYHVLHHFTLKLYEAFIRAGISTRLFEGDRVIAQTVEDPPDITVGFNGAPRNIHGEMFCDEYRIPHLSILVDPPYRFFYLTKSNYTMIGCDDRVCCQLLETIDFKRNLFLPHAVEPELAPEPHRERYFDVVMLATFIDYEARKKKWKSKFSPFVYKMMNEAIEITFSDPSISFIKAFNDVMSRAKKSDPLEGSFLTQILEELEMYVKGRDRIALLKSVPDAQVHVFGNYADELDWKAYLGTKYPHVTVHGAVSYHTALDIMQSAKIVLNPALKNKDGAHERIFSSLASGALVVTNESKFLRETFSENQGVLFYRADQMEQIEERVMDYLSNEKKRKKEVEIGREIVMKYHTWDNRVETIKKAVPPFLKSIPSA